MLRDGVQQGDPLGPALLREGVQQGDPLGPALLRDGVQQGDPLGPALLREGVQQGDPLGPALLRDGVQQGDPLGPALLRDGVQQGDPLGPALLREGVQQGDPLGPALLRDGVQQGDPLGPALLRDGVQQGDPLGPALLREGVQQGDPLGSALFCLTIHSVIKDLLSELCISYLENITIGSYWEDIVLDFRRVELLAQDVDLSLKFNKCQVMCRDHTTLCSLLKNFQVLWGNPESSIHLGSTIGGAEGIDPIYGKKIYSLHILGERLSYLHAHDALHIFYTAHQTSFPKNLIDKAKAGSR